MLWLSNTLVYPCFENINLLEIYGLSAYFVESKLRSVVIANLTNECHPLVHPKTLYL